MIFTSVEMERQRVPIRIQHVRLVNTDPPGMIDPSGRGGGPGIDNSETPPYTRTTYPERLQAAGVSWRVYQEVDNFDDNALAWFASSQNASTSSPLWVNGTVARDVNAFADDVASGSLPQGWWIIAPAAQSEHPIATPAAGAELTFSYLKARADHPDVWRKTVFFLNYDENDGFFDHAVPPTPPVGTPDEARRGAADRSRLTRADDRHLPVEC